MYRLVIIVAQRNHVAMTLKCRLVDEEVTIKKKCLIAVFLTNGALSLKALWQGKQDGDIGQSNQGRSW